MVNIPYKKIYNSYIIETYNYESVKKSIKDFACLIGFDKLLVESENHPDIYYLESKDKNIPIATIKQDIIDSLIYTPKIADKKIYVIYDAVNLEVVVQNAMLKTLEEPPSFVIFFLVTSNSNKFLDTIKSRCITIKDNEDIDYKKLLSLEYLKEAIFNLANAKYSNANDKMKFSEKITSKDNNLKELIMLYRYLIRDALLYSITLSKKNLYLKQLEDDITTLANTYTINELGKFVEGLNKLADVNRNNVNKKIALFNFLEV